MRSFNGNFPLWRCSGRQRRRGERRRHPLGNKPWKKELHHQDEPCIRSLEGCFNGGKERGRERERGCRIEDMICNLGQDGFQQVHAPLYEKIENDSNIPLYYGCTSFTRLSAVLALVNLKARFGWSDKSFIEFLLLLKKLLPEDNMLSKSQYEAKKIICPVGMEY